MAAQYLERLVLENGNMRVEERLFHGRGWRVRSLAQAPDGAVVIGVDRGFILRLHPPNQ